MLQELQPSHFDRARPLFAPLADNLVVNSVLDGRTRGRVFVVDGPQPHAGVLWNEMDTLLLAGDAGAAPLATLRELCAEALIPAAQSRYIPHFMVTVPDDAWAAQLTAVFPQRPILPVARRAFRFTQPSLARQPAAPPGMALRPLHEVVDKTADLDADEARGWVFSFWRTLDEFARHGVGAALVDGRTVVSWCLSVYAAAGALELGVATAAAHRQRGLATVTAAAGAAACLARGATPHWQCDVANAPSLRLAQTLGFTPTRDTTAYKIPFA